MTHTVERSDQITDRIGAWLDRRTLLRDLRTRASTDRWLRHLRLIALASLVVCVLTGVLLLAFYRPSAATVRYDGSYAPLRGVPMSRALDSTLHTSFDVRGGLLVRQLHNWSASLLIVSLLLQVLRVFFTASFRGAQRSRWVLLFLVLVIAMGEGLTGTVLPFDLLSASSLAVLNGILQAMPFVGTDLSALVFRGQFPGGGIVVFYVLHVAVLPLTLIGLAAIAFRARRRGIAPNRRTRVTRTPATAVHAIGILFVVGGVLAAAAAFVTTNPVWALGPADPENATAGSGATWYLAFLDGAQRLVPSGWEFVWLGRTWTLGLLVPVGVCTLFLALVIAYPFLETWLLGDLSARPVAERSRHTPTHTAIGAAGIAFYGVLWAAAGSDQLAMKLSLSLEDVVHVLQLALVLAPVAAFMITRRVCLGLQHRDAVTAVHGHETGRLVRLPSGGFREVHRPVDAQERRLRLPRTSANTLVAQPDPVRPDHRHGRIRAGLLRWYDRDDAQP